VLAQGVAAVATVLLPVAVFVLSGRAQRRVRALLRCRLSKQPPVLYSSSDGGSSPGHSPGTGNEDGAGAPLLSPDRASSEDPLELHALGVEPQLDSDGSSALDACVLPEGTEVVVSDGLVGPNPLAFRSDLELQFEALEDATVATRDSSEDCSPRLFVGRADAAGVDLERQTLSAPLASESQRASET
jgi:hypothetical protein